MDPEVFQGVEVRSFLGDSVRYEVREVQTNAVSLSKGQGACVLAGMGLAGHGCS